ncbi:response regulator transcription factor [soil metagenome]
MPPPSSSPIRVLLVDDHPVVRDGLSALLTSMHGIDVVGQAGSGDEAVREAAIAQPDVVIMDLRMPGLDGVGATREILRARPETAVLVLTMFDEDDLIASALEAGARGYLLKGAEQSDIERAIRTVASGESVFSGEVARKLIGRLTGGGATGALPLPALTVREREVMDRMATGANNQVIASTLHLSPKTLSNHISSIFSKLGVESRSEAIILARDAGLGRSA